jgi:hypothetical protein
MNRSYQFRPNQYEYERPLDSFPGRNDMDPNREPDEYWRGQFTTVLSDIEFMGHIEDGHQKRPLHHSATMM